MVGRQRAPRSGATPWESAPCWSRPTWQRVPAPSPPVRRAGGRPRTRRDPAASGRGRHPVARASTSRSAPTGTARAPTSPSSAPTPSASSWFWPTLTEALGPPTSSSTRPTSPGTATSPGSGPGPSTATGSTVPTSRRDGHRFNPSKLLIDPYARALTGAVAWGPEVFGYEWNRRMTDDCPERAQLRRPRPPLGGGRRPLRLAGDTAPAHPVVRHRRLRGSRQGLHHAPPRRAAGSCGAPTPGSPTPPPSSTSGRWGSPPSS